MNIEADNLIIVGASGLGKEAAWVARRCGMKLQGFVDDRPELQGTQFFGYPVIGTLDDCVNYTDAAFFVAVGSPRIRRNIVQRLTKDTELHFANLVDPGAYIESDVVRMGSGILICAGTVITADVVIGDHCVINKLCSVGHDVVMENFVTLAPKVMLGGHVHLEEGVEVGAAASIRQGTPVQRGAMVGMGSVVVKGVSANTVVFGNPASPKKQLESF